MELMPNKFKPLDFTITNLVSRMLKINPLSYRFLKRQALNFTHRLPLTQKMNALSWGPFVMHLHVQYNHKFRFYDFKHKVPISTIKPH